jgi:hypothetical protein
MYRILLAILREILGPLTEKVEHMNQSHDKRYNQLQRVLKEIKFYS